MALADEPHFEIAASELADYLEREGWDTWWSVDGDVYLMERVSFPCPAEDLGGAIRKVGTALLLADSEGREGSRGQSILATDLNGLATLEGILGDRVFHLGWKGKTGDGGWYLVEDKEIAEIAIKELGLVRRGL